MVNQAIQLALETWVESGRQRDVIRDGRSFVLRYGRRFKLQHVSVLAVFIFFFGIALVMITLGDVATMNFVCLGLFGFLTFFQTIYVAYTFTSRVIIDDARVTVMCFGARLSECPAETLQTAYRSQLHPSVVLMNRGGKKTRISTQFDGLHSLVAWLWLRPRNTLADSILAWMNNEAPGWTEQVVDAESPTTHLFGLDE